MGHAIDPRSRSGDAAPATLDGISILAVRKDTTGAIDPNGDVTPLQVDSDGALKVTGTASANSQYTVDTASSGTENGAVILAVRNDAGGSLVSTDNDLSAIQVDANGALRVLPATHAVTQSGTWNVGSVTTLPSLPTGANTIGAVTQSGTWNVGSVTTLPALPTGANTIGAVTQSGTWNVGSVTTLPSLPTGANTIGAVTQSAGPWTTVERGSVIAHGSASVTTSAAQVLALATDRRSVTIQNLGTDYIYLGATGITANNGLRLAAGDTVVIDKSPTAAIFAIVASGTQAVSYFTESD